MLKKTLKTVPYDLLFVGVVLAILIYGLLGFVLVPEHVKTLIFIIVLWLWLSVHLWFSNIGKRKFKYLRLWNVFGYRRNIYVFMSNRKKCPVNIGDRKKSSDELHNFYMECEHLLEILPSGTVVRTCTNDTIIRGLEKRGIKVEKKEAYISSYSEEGMLLGKEPVEVERQIYKIKFKVP